jgi:hypothetical protein
VAAHAQGKNPSGVNPTHYQCYEVASNQSFQPSEVKLRDQFGGSQVQLLKPNYICAPVRPKRHRPVDKKVQVQNQFGRDVMQGNRREFLQGSAAAAILLAAPSVLFAQALSESPAAGRWDAGMLRHLLPQVSDSRILIKASFAAPLADAPSLRVGGTSFRGRMSDTRGEYWQFYANDLRAGEPHRLQLVSGDGRALCEPWQLATFPAPDERPTECRVLFFSCAGGHEAMKYLSPDVRQRLLRRALSFAPQAAVANGDHVYWDLLSPLTAKRQGASSEAERIAGKFDRAGVVLGADNETVLKRAVGPQIAPVYGTEFRSTPMFFIQDDHDYFDNDEVTDDLVTFPPSHFMLQLARATQHLYYPEYLPDIARPRGLAWSSGADRADGLSETFGTIRYGRLLEVLLYGHSPHRHAGRS